MKLIDVLLKKFEEWPTVSKAISQDHSGMLNELDGNLLEARGVGILIESCGAATWPSTYWQFLTGFHRAELAEDYQTAIVTQEEFLTAKANLATKTPAFIRHRGGKMPVPYGTKIEVRYRNGETSSCVAGDSHSHAWDHSGHNRDIMAYRIVAAPIEPATVFGVAQPSFNPIISRDRIREIEVELKAVRETARASEKSLVAEHIQLMTQLEAEGFKLLDQVNLSSPEDWKIGDKVELLREWDGMRPGIYQITDFDHGDRRRPVELAHSDWPEIEYMRWHSRP